MKIKFISGVSSRLVRFHYHRFNCRSENRSISMRHDYIDINKDFGVFVYIKYKNKETNIGFLYYEFKNKEYIFDYEKSFGVIADLVLYYNELIDDIGIVEGILGRLVAEHDIFDTEYKFIKNISDNVGIFRILGKDIDIVNNEISKLKSIVEETNRQNKFYGLIC